MPVPGLARGAGETSRQVRGWGEAAAVRSSEVGLGMSMGPKPVPRARTGRVPEQSSRSTGLSWYMG